jgi:hypothetical protein
MLLSTNLYLNLAVEIASPQKDAFAVSPLQDRDRDDIIQCVRILHIFSLTLFVHNPDKIYANLYLKPASSLLSGP